MPAPRVKPLNPDALALLNALLADPAKAMCPICGERGFWDNRESKQNEKSPDWKCKNTDCSGATPLKGKRPFAVWCPADDVDTVIPAPKRIQGPGPTETDLPGDPASNWAPRAVPDPEDYPVGGPAVLADAPERPEKADPRREARRKQVAAYKALWALCAAFQREVCQPTEGSEPMGRIPYDGASVNAMAAAIWISWQKDGLLPR